MSIFVLSNNTKMNITVIFLWVIIAIARYLRNQDTVNAQVKIAEIESDKEIKLAKINKKK